ncbi:hypothetical protein PPL_09764 [Heterostelium album PN500]|uniref:Uncharacterized protein n=1 Tax=Heterostelium pallidum (strain ATCC 26659 / Pp 5 / PN500) TaxID=670386 RepID=D3BP02_HETP5|nr:hypothetical protein PPL_09764 [Heterostelium album PN500]EFA77012.1 hypothetical protein PPL_09764 [Heterostelium album PN500]|eukprot:XP_020429142.1 hypothetical protein PPL_09764 [Heterostelium album PN500]
MTSTDLEYVPVVLKFKSKHYPQVGVYIIGKADNLLTSVVRASNWQSNQRLFEKRGDFIIFSMTYAGIHLVTQGTSIYANDVLHP